MALSKIGSVIQLADVCESLGFPLGLLDTMVKSHGKSLEQVSALAISKELNFCASRVEVGFFGGDWVSFRCPDMLIYSFDKDWRPPEAAAEPVKCESWVLLDTMKVLV